MLDVSRFVAVDLNGLQHVDVGCGFCLQPNFVIAEFMYSRMRYDIYIILPNTDITLL